MDKSLQSKIEETFSSLKVEIDGLFWTPASANFTTRASIFDLKQCGLLRLKSLSNMAFLFCDSMLVALWLYVHGCRPLHVHDEDILLQQVSDIVQTFDMEDIPAQRSFVKAMEEKGYRRPFARIVAIFLSRSTAGFDFVDIIRGIATPLSSNSIIFASWVMI